jgi:hypothetical protein
MNTNPTATSGEQPQLLHSIVEAILLPGNLFLVSKSQDIIA